MKDIFSPYNGISGDASDMCKITEIQEKFKKGENINIKDFEQYERLRHMNSWWVIIILMITFLGSEEGNDNEREN